MGKIASGKPKVRGRGLTLDYYKAFSLVSWPDKVFGKKIDCISGGDVRTKLV